MSDGSDQRRLSATLAADVVAYTRRMEEDTEGTVAAWKAARADIISPTLAEHSGRLVKLTGDGFLAEFPTVLDAVGCAIVMQEGLGSGPLDFRMGVNLGDIVDDGEDIHGEGVNIAARIEALADTGGICISGGVHDQVRNRIDQRFEDLGEHQVKHVSAPIRVWRWAPGAPPAATGPTPTEAALTVPDKPSIAVLPFDNMSGDPEQEYFADGLTEDIITSLSKIRWFFVISRNSTFAYKDKSPDPRDIGRELGVRYVLEGSLRTAGKRIRLTAQLIDCATGNHLWAERYNREIEDIFELQDELTQTVVGAIEPQLSRAERDRARVQKPNNLDAWSMLQYGRAHLYKRTREDLRQARTFLTEAITHDPELVAAYSDLAEVCFLEARLGFAEDNAACLSEALDLANKAIEIKGEDAAAHYAFGRILSMKRRHGEAEFELKRALELNPSYSQAYLALGMSYTFSGRAKEAVAPLETGMRLSPFDEYMGPFMARLAEAHLFMGDHETAADWGRRATMQANLPWPGYASLVSILGHLGAADELPAAIAELEKRAPKTDLAFIREQLPISDEGDLDLFIEGLRKAGLPAESDQTS